MMDQSIDRPEAPADLKSSKTGFFKVGPVLLACGVLNGETIEGFRGLMAILIANCVDFDCVDLAGLEVADSDGARLLLEFRSWRPDIRLDGVSPQVRELLNHAGAQTDDK